jgi:hypothetical protein
MSCKVPLSTTLPHHLGFRGFLRILTGKQPHTLFFELTLHSFHSGSTPAFCFFLIVAVSADYQWFKGYHSWIDTSPAWVLDIPSASYFHFSFAPS